VTAVGAFAELVGIHVIDVQNHAQPYARRIGVQPRLAPGRGDGLLTGLSSQGRLVDDVEAHPLDLVRARRHYVH
jgi:hypothetical protein